MSKPHTPTEPNDYRIANVRVPISVVRDTRRFGGKTDGAYLHGNLVITNGVVDRLESQSGDGAPKLILPRLTEAHVHLDKCHSVDRMPAVGGELRAAINAQRSDKVLWTENDLRERATCGLKELVAAGCKTARSHVDWPSGAEARETPLAWRILQELKQDYRDQIELQLSPLTTLADVSDPQTAQLLGQESDRTNGALGSFVLDQDDLATGIQAAFDIAIRYGLPLDFHVDEGLAPELEGLKLIAETAIKTGFDGPILCGHACSLMNLTGDALARQIDLIMRAGISIVTLPATNLYLQGRVDGTPDRRGLTRIRELRAAGVPVIVGSDNVRDAFCPLGHHDPRASLQLAVLAAHLDPPLADLWSMITTDAERALGVAATFVDHAKVGDVRMCDAASTTAALSANVTLRPLSAYADGNLT